MKFILLILLTYSTLFCKVYYSKIEPYEIRDISSNVTGVVEFVDENMIGKRLSKVAYIKIDNLLNTKELQSVTQKIIFIKETLSVNQKILKNINNSLQRKRENYKQIENLKIKSRIEKDREFYDLINSENSYLNTQKELNNLKIQLADLELRQLQLQRTISDKTFIANGFILYSIDVKIGQVVNIATHLAQIADTSKALITIYLDDNDVLDAKSKTIYINGKKTEYKVNRLLKIADSKNISKYKAQIIIKSPKLFSQLVKIEFKEKLHDN